MLVLRRESGQSFTIGENAEIIIKVLRNENGVVSIGIDAPLSVIVNRLEILEKRLKSLSPIENHYSTLNKRLENFEKRIKNARVSNDPIVAKSLYTI